MDLYKALELYAKPFYSEYSCGETYESLEWFEINEQPKPMLDELERLYDLYLVQKERNRYLELRTAAYPSPEEQLDIIYTVGIEAWRDQILRIKNKYPRIEGEVYKKPVNNNVIFKQMEKLEQDFIQLKKDLADNNVVEQVVNDMNDALKVINGFLMEIPNIQKQLEEIETRLKA